MSHTKRIYSGPTKPRTCKVPVRMPGMAMPIPCGSRAFKASQCSEHFFDAKHAREARAIEGNAINPARRAKKALGLSGRQWVKHRKAERRAA